MMLPIAWLGTILGRVGGLKLGREARASVGSSVGVPGSVLRSGSTLTPERSARDRLALSASGLTVSVSAIHRVPQKNQRRGATRVDPNKIGSRAISLRELRESKKSRARSKFVRERGGAIAI